MSKKELEDRINENIAEFQLLKTMIENNEERFNEMLKEIKETEKKELKISSCPFCGGKSVLKNDFNDEYEEDEEDEEGNYIQKYDYWVYCTECEATGPIYKEDKISPIEDWNDVRRVIY